MQIVARNLMRAVVPGQSLNVWLQSDAEETYWPGEARPMPDTVDYRFVNGWVDTGDLPCREALRTFAATRKIRLQDRRALTQLHPGGESPRVDFSTFRWRPALVSRWFSGTLQAAEPLRATFEIETCGATHLWAGTEKVAAFEPYDRNIPHSRRLTISLPAGATELTVYLDDLHERDTSCFFRLTLIEGDGLAWDRSVDPAVETAAQALADLRSERLFHDGGDIRILTGAPVPQPLKLMLADQADAATTMNVLADSAKGAGQATLRAPDQAETFLPVDGLKPGCVGLNVEARVAGVTLSRSIGVTYLPEPLKLDGATLAARKAQARKQLVAASQGQPTPARALVLLDAGQCDAAETLLGPALVAVEERQDCADFFLLPLLRIWRDHQQRLSQGMRRRLKAAILGFRYWLDEPGNDVMWFWSENHALCFHAAQYLAGSMMPEAVFDNSGLTGAKQAARGHARLLRWFASIEDHGFAEWNSAAYYPIDLLGLLSLVDMAPDREIARRAAGLCDRIFAMVALHTIGGVPAGSQGRVYEKELFAGPATELGTIAAIAYGGPWYDGHDRAAALLAMSDYAPPKALADLARVPRGEALNAAYVQGLDQNARLSLWKSSDVQLSSVTDHKTGAPGHQQHVVDIQFAADPLARVWVNHPGDLRVWGGGRPSYWAGSGAVPRVAQHGDTCFVIFDLDVLANPIALTHAFVPRDRLDEIIAEAGWLFLRSGDGFAALWASAPMQLHDKGLFAGSEWRVAGPKTGWVLRVGARGTHGDFADFRADTRGLTPTFDDSARRLAAGNLELRFDGPLRVNGRDRPFRPLDTRPHVGRNTDDLRPLTLNDDAE